MRITCEKIEKKDYTNLYTSCLTIFSGNWNNAANAGAFQLNVNNTFSLSNANVSCHLLFSTIEFFYMVRNRRRATWQNTKNPVYLY